MVQFSVFSQDVALVELSGSDSESEEDKESSSDSSEEELESNVVLTERNLKLPGHKGKKESINIQVVEQPEK